MLARLLFMAVCGLGLAGCAPGQDVRLFRDGIGTDLYSAGGADSARLQDAYVAYVCDQTGLAGRAGDAGCIPDGSRDWEVFVQAGLNDIDTRCDAYLAWLDNKRRSSGPVQQEISDVRTATTSILAATGVGVTPIAVVGAAFGLASSTFANIQSRLVLEVNHSTVQTIVLSAQRRLRLEIKDTRIDNRPAAMHALRQYLRICQPFTIETEINTTITAFERGGAAGVAFRNQLVDASSVGKTLTSTTPIAPVKRPPAKPGAVPLGEFETRLGPKAIKSYQVLLCITPADGTFTAETRTAILTFLRSHGKDANFPDRITDLDGTKLQAMIDDKTGPACGT